MAEKSDDATVANANLVEHLKNIDVACDDARLSPWRKSAALRRKLRRLRPAYSACRCREHVC